MKHIAIIGFGIVGGGIPDVLESCKEGIKQVVGDGINVKYILDLREFPDHPLGDRVVHDIAPILEDPEVELVAETMGGTHPAFDFSIAAMKAGKSVVTSNKEVVATKGIELLQCARENGVNYLFEASVGGGIPALRPFATSLSQENIVSVRGILNGTTNFILSKMKSEGREFSDVLAEAQALGYAERDPSADVDGIDAKRKIMILTALATGKLAKDTDVYAETIRNITPADMDAAARLGGAVKLIGTYKATEAGPAVYVCPQIVGKEDALTNVDDVYNAISVTGEITGDVMFYGRGAGRFPTAGAIVADITAVLSGAAKAERIHNWVSAEGDVVPFDTVPFSYYIRVNGASAADTLETASHLFEYAFLTEGSPEGKIEMICGNATKAELDAILPSLGEVESVIRIAE